MKKKAKEATPAVPYSHLASLHDAGFTVISYLNKSIEVRIGEDDTKRREWLPALCVGPGSRAGEYRVIEWLPAGDPRNHYGFDGWQPSSGHSFGAMCETIGQALSWLTWLEEREKKVGK